MLFCCALFFEVARKKPAIRSLALVRVSSQALVPLGKLYVTHPWLSFAESVKPVSRPSVVSGIAHNARPHWIQMNIKDGLHFMLAALQKCRMRAVLGYFATPIILSVEIRPVARMMASHLLGK